MPSPLAARVSPICLLLAFAAPASAQEEVDSLTPADSLVPADTEAAADTLQEPPIIREDPRLTWLGDTLALVDTLAFTEPIEVIPDSLFDPYTVERPGARPVF